MKTLIATTALAALLATTAFASGNGGGNPGAGFLDEWDTNTDGTVTIEEVAERRSDIFVSFDADDNGVLDADEYAFFDEARASSHDDEAGHGGEGKAAVGMTLPFNDVDGNGSVAIDEFVGQSGAWMALVDRNRDGVVTVQDFGPNR